MNIRKIKKMEIEIIFCVLITILLGVILFFIFPKQKSTNKSPSTTQAAPNSSSRQNNSPAGFSQGGAMDNNGVAVSTDVPVESNWTKSDSGLITLKNPTTKAILKSGDEISGVSGVEKVQYRLVDTVAGVISQGVLNVVDGSFAGNIFFSSYSDSGVLVVFSLDALGREKNEIQVLVGL